MVFLENYVDKRSLQYPFMDSPKGPLIFISFYLIAIYGGPKIMEKRKAFDLKITIAVYNLIQVFLCFVLIKALYDGGFSIDYFWKCVPCDYTQTTASLNMLYATYLTFLLKALEFSETIFFVLRKKNNQISKLHVYHHISTFTIAWFYARSIGGSMMVFSIYANSIVHIFMYSYYFVSTFGPTVQKKLIWFKKSITTIQIIQFVLLMINTLKALLHCNISKLFIVFYLPNITFLLILFSNFYRYSYNSKNKINKIN